MIEPERNEEEEMSVFALAAMLLRARWRILRWMIIGGMLAGLSVLSKPVVYAAAASFIPEGYDAGRSGFAGLAGQLGVSIPTSGNAAVSPDFYSMLLRSRVLLEPIVRDTLTVAEQGGRRVTFFDLFKIGGSSASTREEQGVSALKGMIAVSVDKTTGVVTVTVTAPWRSVALAIAQQLVKGVNDYNSRVRQGQAATERQFVEGRLAVASADLRAAEDRLEAFLRTNRDFSGSPELIFQRDRLQREVTLRQQIFNSLTQSFEEARIREVRNTPVITVFEAPSVPSTPVPRGRVKRVMLGLLVGALAGILLAFGSGMFAARRKLGDAEADEFARAVGEAKGEFRNRLRSMLAGRTR